jgi:hypothetical protein
VGREDGAHYAAAAAASRGLFLAIPAKGRGLERKVLPRHCDRAGGYHGWFLIFDGIARQNSQCFGAFENEGGGAHGSKCDWRGFASCCSGPRQYSARN